jgi:hypothetical protein
MSEKRYVRPTVAGWLAPTLVAPWISVYAGITAFFALGFDKGLFGKVLGWVAGMAVGTVWTLVYCLMLVLIDLVMLGVKVRTLPAGKRGWAISFLSPLAVMGAYIAVPPYSFISGGPWAVGAAVLVPMLLVAIVTRVFGGVKPPR